LAAVRKHSVVCQEQQLLYKTTWDLQ